MIARKECARVYVRVLHCTISRHARSLEFANAHVCACSLDVSTTATEKEALPRGLSVHRHCPGMRALPQCSAVVIGNATRSARGKRAPYTPPRPGLSTPALDAALTMSRSGTAREHVQPLELGFGCESARQQLQQQQAQAQTHV